MQPVSSYELLFWSLSPDHFGLLLFPFLGLSVSYLCCTNLFLESIHCSLYLFNLSPESVIRRFEQRAHAVDSRGVAEYMRALVATNAIAEYLPDEQSGKPSSLPSLVFVDHIIPSGFCVYWQCHLNSRCSAYYCNLYCTCLLICCSV